MAGYIPRVVDLELNSLLADAPALALEGPKAVGKTETLRRRAATTYLLDDVSVRNALEAAPNQLADAAPPVLLDEWQRLPLVWDLVRRHVDADPRGSRFLLSGSAAPLEAPVHSGAGRIITLRMRPLSLFERQMSNAHISLEDLLTGVKPSISGSSAATLGDYLLELVASGFPAIRNAPARVRDELLDGYLERLAQRDFPDQGHRLRRPDALKAWLRAYAAATATTASYSSILDAATPGEGEKPARGTTEAFRSVLTELFVLDPLGAWAPAGSHLQRLGRAPAHHLADPALAARLLGLSKAALLRGQQAGPISLRDGNLLGRLFESLVVQSVRVYAQANRARVYFLRTSRGDHEVDIIVERSDGRVVAMEVKLTSNVTDEDVKHLRWLGREIGEELLDAVVITPGQFAYRRPPDMIAVIPAAMLAP